MEFYEPKLTIETKLTEILKELTALEIFIHWPAVGTSQKKIDELLDSEFWEVGASGKRYGRDFVLNVLQERSKKINVENWISEGFHCQQITVNSYLLTYNLLQDQRLTRRMSIWKKNDSTWKLFYHQGTVV